MSLAGAASSASAPDSSDHAPGGGLPWAPVQGLSPRGVLSASIGLEGALRPPPRVPLNTKAIEAGYALLLEWASSHPLPAITVGSVFPPSPWVGSVFFITSYEVDDMLSTAVLHSTCDLLHRVSSAYTVLEDF